MCCAGTDTADYTNAAGGIVASLLLGTASNRGDWSNDVLISIENITGSTFADTVTGNAGVNVISGGAGNDYIFASGGGDTIDGGAGLDTLDYTTGGATSIAVTLNGATPVTVTVGGGINDLISNIENITGTTGVDTI